MTATTTIPSHPLRFILYVTRPFKIWAVGAVCAVIFATGLESALYYVIKLLIDSINSLTGPGSLSKAEFWKWVIIYPCLNLTISLVWRCSGFCGQRWLTGVEATSYRTLFEYMTGHSSSYFQSRFAGSLSNKISNVATGVLQFLATSLWQFLSLGISFITNGIVVFLAHPLIALVFAIWLCIFAIINIILVRKLTKLSFKTAEASSELRGKIVDTSTNIATVQQGGHRLFEHNYVGKFIDSHRGAHLNEWYASEWVLVTNNVLIALFIAAMLGTSLYLLNEGSLSIGSVVMVITVMGSMYINLLFISMTAIQAIGHYGKIKEGLDELLVPHEITDAEKATNLLIQKGEISYKNVNFSYSDSPVFTDLSLHISAGQKVGVVGPSGAGKTTLVNTLLRQYEIGSGSITIDGLDIRKVTLESLRKGIALVPQDVSLFHRKVIENIRYGRLEASDNEVEQAAERAQASEFIKVLPQKYQTYVGERGIKLSGGQRQRIAIARAFLKNAPILVLDEATSSLDSESEEAVQIALNKLFQGRTVLAIAHRLSTLRAMDRIIVLEAGKIVEDGNHEELLVKNGLYAKLWNSQVKGFIPG